MLSPPLSEGASKFGEVLNFIKTVTLSEKKMSKSDASVPEEIVKVESSETMIVAAVTDVAIFSTTEKDEDEVKEGGVVSGALPAATLAISL
jgi:hypothetical protein